MDIIALGFYALICGLLSLLAPSFGTRFLRFGIGAAVGIAAAATLPIIKNALGAF